MKSITPLPGFTQRLGAPLKPFLLLMALLLSLAACREDKETTITRPTDPNPVDTAQDGSFKEVAPTAEQVMYEVNLRAMSSSGDLQGVIGKLDHIKSLGVNVIWLMPIHPVGEFRSINSPYCVKDHRAVGAEYGSLADLQELVQEAHQRNMAVIMDWVANHTAWDHPWIQNKSWYTQDGSGAIVHPPGTNWQDVADLNFGNQNMRDSMKAAMQYWIDAANIDGFRCDYADGVPFDFWQKAISKLRSQSGKKLLFFAEGARQDHFAAGFDLAFGWDFYGALKNVFNGQSVNLITAAHSREYQNTPAGKHWVRFTANHDESAWDATPISLFNGADGALAASAIAAFTGGVPLIYSSQEVGISQTIPFFSRAPINWNNNPALLAQYQQMFQFYRQSAVAQKGVNTIYPGQDVFSLRKTLEGQDLWLLVNVRDVSKNYDLPAPLQNTTWTHALSQETQNLSGSLVLGPYEILILK